MIQPELTEFRFYSRRAVVVDWKNDPIGNGNLVNVWTNRIKDLKDYNNLNFEILKDKCYKYDCDYIVITSDHKDFTNVTENMLIRDSNLKIIKIEDTVKS